MVIFSLAGQRGWNKMDMLRVNPLHLTLRMEVEPIPIKEKDFDFMCQEGDIGAMDYDQAVKNGDIFFGWSTWMEQDGYDPGESIAFDFENGSGTYTYQGKIAGSFVSADTYLVSPEGVYRSMTPRGTAYGYLWVDCDKKDVASVEQSLNTLISNTSHIKMDTGRCISFHESERNSLWLSVGGL